MCVKRGRGEGTDLNTPEKKWHWGTWTKNVKNNLKITLYGGSLFSRNGFFPREKKSTSTQEEQGSKLGPKIWVFFRTDFLYCKNRKQCFTKKLKFWWKFPIKNSDFGENLITRGSIYDTFLTWHLGQRSCLRSIFFEKCWSKKLSKNRRKIFSPKRSEIHFPGLGALR